MHEGKLCFSLFMALIITSLSNCAETTQQYLENAVRSLKNLRQLQTFRTEITQAGQPPARAKTHRRSYQYADKVPPLSLTKGELATLYEQALAKGETLKLDTGGDEYIQAAVHHLDDEKPPEDHESSNYAPIESQHDFSHHEGQNEDAGYYYYYYPLKSFLDEITSQPTEKHTESHYHKPSYHHKELTTYKPPFTYHSHHHQHNVTIQTAKHDKKEVKPMEPLFMAISGFIGMAVMFLLSMVVLPKFGKSAIKDIKKKEKLDDFARFALNAIEGHCAERFACELTKSARSFDIEDNRFYKLLKRVAPGTFGRYINDSTKYANKQLQCTAIPCKKKRPNNNTTRKPPNPHQKKKNNVNKKL